MIELNVIQGTPEWHAARAKCFTASEASAMMGVSKYMTRSELIRQKATGIIPEVDAGTQARFDAGHAAEAKARKIAEKIIGEELYPITATTNCGKYLASSDGATMLCDTGWEHKLFNAELAASVDAGIVPDSHKWQLVHQAMVFDFKRIMFSVSDGTEENFHYCWFVPTADDFNRLVPGWNQFEKDVESYQPEERKQDAAVGVAPDALPALRIEVTGMVTASNLEQFKSAALAVFRGINTELVTDQDFADAEKAVKFCKEAEEKLDAAKEHALSQTESIDALFKTIDAIKEEARTVRLKLDKLVKTEKESRKVEIVTAALDEFRSHLHAQQNRVSVNFQFAGQSFAESIKGLKSLDSMRDKVSVALANAKIEANAIADRIDANRKTVEDMSLFPDFAQVCTKAPEDFAALLAMRIGQRREAEEKRLAAERERIRAEEQAKAQREAAERAASEKREADAKAAAEQAERDRLAAEEIRRIDAERKAKEAEAALMDSTVCTPAGTPLTVVHDSSNDGPTMNLGQINAALGFTVSEDFLSSLGIQPARQEKSAKLYDANKFPTICRLISDHVMRQALKKAA